MNKDSAIEVTKFLPHRAPFLVVDRITFLSSDNISSTFKIPEDSIFLEDNFFSEVGLLECAAQSCSTIVGKPYVEKEASKNEKVQLIGYISSIKKAKIYALAKAGEHIEIRARLISNFEAVDYQLCTMVCDITKKKIKLLSCELNLVIREVN
jgi:3-hydroxymyristoyl/3-hydroxydecanoyl-(acyl carrier protein) dehydratase